MPFINHAIIHPPVDRNMAPGAPGGPTDIYVRVTKETDAGIRVSGAKVVATGSALTHYTFVAHHGLIPVQDKNFAMVFIVPTNAAGVKLICRVSNEQRAAVLGSPFDYPLSSRLDENDAIFVMDDVLVPWENVFVYADVEKANNFFPRTGFLPRALLHGCTRLAVKLDFIIGLFIKATEMTGARGFRGVEANLGEVIAWRNMIWGLSDAMAKPPDPWAGGCVLPGMEPAAAYQVLAPEAYVQIKNLIEKTVASGLIYLNSHARTSRRRRLRKYLDLYVRGSGGVSAVERVKLMKLLWDAIGTEFGGRHELYEINYAGSHEEIRRYALFGAIASGEADRWKGFAGSCMAEYDLDGWTVPDLINPGRCQRAARMTGLIGQPMLSRRASSVLEGWRRCHRRGAFVMMLLAVSAGYSAAIGNAVERRRRSRPSAPRRPETPVPAPASRSAADRNACDSDPPALPHRSAAPRRCIR